VTKIVNAEPKLDVPVQLVAPARRLAVTKQEAAAVLGMSVDSFERYVMPHVRAVRKGKLRLFPVEELERWLRENASRPPAGDA
jgi:excisionase family DNA binding protein